MIGPSVILNGLICLACIVGIIIELVPRKNKK